MKTKKFLVLATILVIVLGGFLATLSLLSGERNSARAESLSLQELWHSQTYSNMHDREYLKPIGVVNGNYYVVAGNIIDGYNALGNLVYHRDVSSYGSVALSTGFYTQPVVWGDTIVLPIGGTGSRYYAFSLSDDKSNALWWQIRTGEVVVPDNDILIEKDVSSGTIYAFNSSNGALVWKSQYGCKGQPLGFGLAAANGIVYTQGCINDDAAHEMLLAISETSGSLVWSALLPAFCIGGSHIVVLNGRVMVEDGVDHCSTLGDNIDAFDAVLGTKLWSKSFATDINPYTAQGDGNLYIALMPMNGVVSVYGIKGSDGSQLFTQNISLTRFEDRGDNVRLSYINGRFYSAVDGQFDIWDGTIGTNEYEDTTSNFIEVYHANPLFLWSETDSSDFVLYGYSEGQIAPTPSPSPSVTVTPSQTPSPMPANGSDWLFVMIPGLNTSYSGNGTPEGYGPIVNTLQSKYPGATFLYYSYPSQQANGYTCADTYTDGIDADILSLSSQIQAKVVANPNIKKVGLFGHSLGGTIADAYAAAVAEHLGVIETLPVGVQLKAVATMDSPLSGVTLNVATGIISLLQNAFCKQNVPLVRKAIDQLTNLYKTARNSKRLGVSASIVQAILGGKYISNQKVADDGKAQGITFLTIGNTNDPLYKPPCFSSGSFTSTQWLRDEGFGVYGREFTSKPAVCLPDSIEKTHGAVLVFNAVLKALVQVIEGKVPSSLATV